MRSFGLRVSGAVAPSASPPPLPDEAELSRIAIRPNPGGDNKLFAEAANPVNQSFWGFTQRSKQQTRPAEPSPQKFPYVETVRNGPSFPPYNLLCGGSSAARRSEERRGGKEGVSTCRYRWSPEH